MKPKRSDMVPDEHSEQVAVMQWAAAMTARKSCLRLLYAIPNGGERNRVVAAKLKAEGVKPGVPDLCLPWPSGGYHGLYIEMKRRKGGRVSTDQIWWHDGLDAAGYRVVVCKGADRAIDAIKDYLFLSIGDK